MGGAASYFTAVVEEVTETENVTMYKQLEDDYVERISKIKDIESDQGEVALSNILKELRVGLAEIPGAGNKVVYTALPWEGLSRDAAKQVKKEIYALAKDELSLTITKEELEYGLRFNIGNYFILATILLKHDRNLKDMRERLVPTDIEEDDFWFNYFYQIESIKKQLGLSNMLLPLDYMN